MRLFIACCLFHLFSFAILQVRAEEAVPRRARAPEWPPEVINTFFIDARKHLVGPRPQKESKVRQPVAADQEAADTAGDEPWSTLVYADTLTSEVKSIHNRLTLQLPGASRFKSGGNIECRREFSLLATLFEVIGQFDEQMHWQEEAAGMKAVCAQAAAACEIANDESFALAAEAHALLADLLRGQSPDTRASGSVAAVERGQLMQRMERAIEENISPKLASLREFRRRKSQVAHESQLLALLARIIRHPEYDFADDEGFLDLARELGHASRELTEACEASDYEGARQAAGRVTRSCSDCHEGYRG